jgi:hypothetical protein
MGLRFGRDRFLDVAPSGNNRIGSVGRLEIPGAVGEGLQIGGDVRAYRGANGELYLVPLGGQPVMIPAGTPATDGLYIGAAGSGCRVYRGANGELYLVPVAGQRVIAPNEGLQIGADVYLYRDAAGNLMFHDSTVPFDRQLSRVIMAALIRPRGFCDIAGGVIESPFGGVAVTGGTGIQGSAAIDTDHPGTWLLQSVAAANSGYAIRLHTSGGSVRDMLVGGGERFTAVSRYIADANTIARFGFIDIFGATPPVDGVYFYAAAGVVDGRTMSNSVGSVTGTTYALTANTWHRFEISINAAANLVTYTIRLCSTGAVMWNSTLNTSIPTGAGRATSVGATAYNTAGGSIDLWEHDLIEYNIDRPVVR